MRTIEPRTSISGRHQLSDSTTSVCKCATRCERRPFLNRLRMPLGSEPSPRAQRAHLEPVQAP